ncbi:carboxypeptidase regulatory-like domain-containing protein [Pyxidicoccus fallax]|uniref:Carboxypeptidase regulatory-like domain-containing protein n=1 Tax=Pyxidicoccus fallax TaxID=394095 RepID=A0A848L8W0_9BACT|nr:carboxypeptidase-like regulatory domain-containing protein [Pyxidicoccus fallax]NMO15430.1 carboxypeptidase regulatory-like domain-containing protein [Pyxidicoccus fallax]NPC79125.1 carboxypeptidase regulatory-like domain-containing protein [Pyxidicoccus fallax]
MRRRLGGGAGLLVLLASVWFLRCFGHASDLTPMPDSPRTEQSSAEPVRASALLTAPVAPARGDKAIRGTVVGPSGPVAGAVVVATAPRPEVSLSELPCDSGEGRETKLLHIQCGTTAAQLVEAAARRRGEAPPLARTTTDARGRFALEGLEPGEYAVWAEAVSGTGRMEEVAAGREGVEVRLEKALHYQGTVRDEDGAPVVGARVTALHLEHSRYFEGMTEGNGRFRLAPLPPGQYVLLFSRSELLPVHWVPRGDVEQDLDVTMYRPRRLTGRVVRAREPVSGGVSVQLLGERRMLSAVTDDTGRFTFDRLPLGAFTLTASHGGQDAVAQVRLARGVTPPEVELSLGTGVRVRGTVRDERGRPIAGAQVRLRSGSGRYEHDWKSTETDAKGAYTLGPVAPRRYSFEVGAERFIDDGAQERAVDGLAPVDFVLKAAVVLEGQVVDAEGRPVKQALLLLKEQDDLQGLPDRFFMGSDGSYRSQTESKEDGTFVMKAPDEGSWFLKGFHDDHVATGLMVTAPRSDIRLVLRAGAEVSGEVVDEQGAPMRRASVSLTVRSAKRDRAHEKSTRTDAMGRFTLRGIHEGAYFILASSLSQHDHRLVSRELEVRGTAPVHVRLQYPEGERVSGGVVDPEGRPLPGVTVQVGRDARRQLSRKPGEPGERFGRSPSRVKSDAEGRFAVLHLDPGTWTVSASLEGYRLDTSASRGGAPDEGRQSLEVPAGTADVHLVMRRTAAVRGRVVREDGSPVMRFEVNGRSITDTDGAFFEPVAKAVDVALTFTANGLAGTARTVRVEEDVHVDLGMVVLKQGREVRGRVTDAATGAPVAGARVDVEDVPADAEGSVRLPERSRAVKTAMDGTFTLPHVEERPHSLVVVHPDFLPKRIPLDARRDAVEVALDAGAILRGTVRNGGRMLDQSVAIEAVDLSFREYTPVRNGTFEQRRLHPGTYVLRVHTGRSKEEIPVYAPRRIQVPANATVTVDFEPRTGGATVHVTMAKPPEDKVTAVLVPGQVAMVTSARELERATAQHFRAHPESPGRWTFRAMPAGTYTVFVAHRTKRGVAVHREELVVPARGEVTRELVPRWHEMGASQLEEEAP